MSFYYRGVIPASKSLMNRALICASYSHGLQLLGDTSCDDVMKMKEALQKLNSSAALKVYDCGAAGTVLRFLTLRLSRLSGRHILQGTKRLLLRPQEDLLKVLQRLGVTYELTEEQLILQSEGWKNLAEPIVVERGVSSQFASGLILNAWNLEQDLILKMHGNPISEGYLDMTLQVVRSLGMRIEIEKKSDPTYTIKAHSTPLLSQYQVESDLSSAFAIAAFAALNGQAHFEQFPHLSLQPDFEFVTLIKKMGIPLKLEPSPSLATPHLITNNNEGASAPSWSLQIEKINSFNGIEANLKSCPDLFPVLAVLCSFAQTPSRLYGAPQLIHKESNRIEKTSELLTRIGVPHEKKSDGMIITPKKIPSPHSLTAFSYDTDHDHRLAFAAALVRSQGFPITIEHPEVVTKSFPEFWQIVGF